MFKIFTVVSLLLTCSSTLASDEISSLFRTREYVQASLWNDGIQVDGQEQVDNKLPEELLIALDQYEETH
ncbi:MAG: hypothetical protein HON90_11815 [Halobacteriovoraceae bacterium]|jgi:hypothetical protein|nr:hypothetical protein [Halobacteriovoraceae bacterium]